MNFLTKRRCKSSAVDGRQDAGRRTTTTTVVAHLKHPLGRDGVALDLHPPEARLEGGRHRRTGSSSSPPLPLVGSGPYTVTSWNPNGTTVMERNPHFRGAQHRARARADDLLRRQQRRGHRPRAEPAGRDAERHARRARRAAARAHERRARLPLAGDRPRVLGLQPRSARDLARAQGASSGPARSARRWPGRSTARKLVQAALLGLRSARQHAALAQLRRASRSTSRRIPCSATTTTPRSARRILDAGRLESSAPTACAARTACAPRSSSPTRATRARSGRSR